MYTMTNTFILLQSNIEIRSQNEPKLDTKGFIAPCEVSCLAPLLVAWNSLIRTE